MNFIKSTKPTSDISIQHSIALWMLFPIAVTLLLISTSFGILNPKPVKNQYVNIQTKTFTEVHLDSPIPIYKKDTVEYLADDYALIPNATVEDLVKKLLGFDVDGISSITYSGQPINKGKLNGKDLGGDDLYAAIRKIQVDTIEKLLVVNDYSEPAVRTYYGSIAPAKVLNLTTYIDKKAFIAAKRTITGKVTDRQGAVLIGAKVRVAGTEKKTAETDANGNFKIDLPASKNILAVDYVGHNHLHINVNKMNKLNIKLEPYKYAYNEVVIVDGNLKEKKPITTPEILNCKENTKFKTTYFYNVHIAQQYAIQSRAYSTITDADLKKALSYLNRYNKIPIDKLLTDTSYPYMISFLSYTSQCLKWYEENKCSNLK
jgi:hypothetical protein